MTDRLKAIDDRIRGCVKALARAREDLKHLEGEIVGLKGGYDIFAGDRVGTVNDVEALQEIETRLRLAGQKRAVARDQILRLEGEFEGLQIAREIAGGNERLPVEGYEEPNSGGREISAPWRKILGHFLARLPHPLNIDDVMAFIGQNDLNISRNAVRSQLHLYANRGFLKRVTEGTYRATDAIKRVC